MGGLHMIYHLLQWRYGILSNLSAGLFFKLEAGRKIKLSMLFKALD